MPWHVAPSQFCPASKPWAVVRDVDGSIVACHVTRDEAHSQMAALYAHQELEGYSPQKEGSDDDYPVGNVSQRDGSTFAGSLTSKPNYPGDGAQSCTGTCQTGDDDEDNDKERPGPDPDDFGEGASGAFDNGDGKPDGTPDVPPPYTIINPPKVAIMNQVPWQQTGPAAIPCPYTTPTSQVW